MNIKKLFYWWMDERQWIYLKKERGDPWPWTADKILQQYKFTNVYRQQDAVTRKLTEELRRVHYDYGDHKKLLFRIYVFRIFNWPDTYYELAPLIDARRFRPEQFRQIILDRKARKDQMFTGAYIVTNNGSTTPKHELYTEACLIARDMIYKSRLVKEIENEQTLEYATQALRLLPMVGAFISYEMVTDLRWTPILEHAEDIYTWANPGPGAKRGLNRIFSPSHDKNDNRRVNGKQDLLEEMRTLLNEAPNYTNLTLEMRDIEHSLCEFDKYMRVKNNEGRPRSKYHHG